MVVASRVINGLGEGDCTLQAGDGTRRAPHRATPGLATPATKEKETASETTYKAATPPLSLGTLAPASTIGPRPHQSRRINERIDSHPVTCQKKSFREAFDAASIIKKLRAGDRHGAREVREIPPGVIHYFEKTRKRICGSDVTFGSCGLTAELPRKVVVAPAEAATLSATTVHVPVRRLGEDSIR